MEQEKIQGKEDKIIEKRKEKLFYFFRKSQLWVILILFIALFLGVYIRSMPMHDHGGKPGLWDITTDTWTLGPDLDPWLFTRYAETIVEQGSLPKNDEMRNVPLGFDTSKESKLLPYMIVYTYKFLNIFGNYNIEFAAAIFPVIMFALTIISFFLFVREVFIRKSKQGEIKANIIALISTFFMIVIPIFLSRTIAGIPEKESAAFFFLFLALYLFLKAWKSKSLRNSIILALFAGLITALLRLISGLVLYVFITIAGATLIAFLLNKVRKKEFLIYTAWIITSFSLILILYSNKFDLIDLISSLETGLATLTMFILLIDLIFWKLKLSNLKIFNHEKIPKRVISLIISIILLIILSSIVLGPSFITDKIKAVHQAAFRPVIGRWNTTVAENRQPYLTEWINNFGPFIKNIPLLFWLSFIGSVILFKKALLKLKKKDAVILTLFYGLLFLGMTFSRYSSSGMFNGVNFISKFFYYGSVFLFIISAGYFYIKYSKEGSNSFEKIRYDYIFLFILFLLAIFTARGAVRLIMVLGPIAPIFLSFLIVELLFKFKNIKDETWKIIIGALIILIIIASMFTFWTFYKSVKYQAYNFVPSSYNQQWQKAMSWVRENTTEDSVFGHWWDYGYWVQSIGKRPTVLDGGNAVSFWNYYMGRLVLTGDNQDDALEFLYNHNTDYFLIDSTDIGKYGAFSSIGSNEHYDRYSWFGTFILDEKQTQETKNQTLFFYSGGVSLDEDLIIQEDSGEVYLPQGKSGIGAIILSFENTDNSKEFKQPYAIVVYQGKQYQMKIRYASINNEFIDFETGVEGCAYIMPKISDSGGVQSNQIGAITFISPRQMRGMFSQIYLLNDPFNNFPNFKLTHTESSRLVDSLNNQGMNLPEFVYYKGIHGPIKIWEIEYTGKEKLKEEYTDRDPTKYLNWTL